MLQWYQYMYDIPYNKHNAYSLTHTPFPPDKTAAISQTIFADAFSWMKSFVILQFHWILFQRV